MMQFVLAGNPNAGKTALFNALTGGRQRVGNWPGVTVERREGHIIDGARQIDLVDLPGVYSLTVPTGEVAVDAQIACEFLLNQKADAIINVIDGTQLERHLFLTLQLQTLGLPMVVVLNMADIVKRRGMVIDEKKLSRALGCPVVSVAANRGTGVASLKQTLLRLDVNSVPQYREIDLPRDLSVVRKSIIRHLTEVGVADREAKMLSLALMEGNQCVAEWLGEERVALMGLNDTADIEIASLRHAFASRLALDVLSIKKPMRATASEYVDRVVLNRFLGLPIFLGIMYLLFFVTINVGGVFQESVDRLGNAFFVDGFAHCLRQVHAPDTLIAILATGLGKGISTTLTFIPVLGAMFFGLSFFEDSGYMSRAAFVVDRFMRLLGLPGKAFVPMIVGFGCNVPAVMGARTLASPRDRLLTVLMMPFMSCGARLAIFAVFVSAFFVHQGENVIFLLYFLGIAVAILTGLVLRYSILKGKPAALVMELPPYHFPRLSVLCRHALWRLKHFIWRAGKVIVLVSTLLGALNSVQVGPNMTALSRVGRAVTPVFAPMGVHQDNWPATVGLLTGVLAKEVVVGTLNTLYSQSAHLRVHHQKKFKLNKAVKKAFHAIPKNISGLKTAIKNPIRASAAGVDMDHRVYGVMHQRFVNWHAAFSYLLFVLLYFPCVSTLAAMRREVGARWAGFSMGWSLFMAYGVAVLAYQWATAAAHPMVTTLWTVGMGVSLIAVVLVLRLVSRRPGVFSDIPVRPRTSGKPGCGPCGGAGGDCH